MTDSSPGWQPDPTGRHDHRYWDGTQWTDNVADAGVAATDPYDGPLEAGPEEAAEAPPADTGTDGDAGDAGDAAPPPADAAPPDAPAPGTEPTVVGPAPIGDPTSTWPAAGTNPPPPSYAAPPPPTMPVTPAAAAAASSGSKKGLLIGAGVLVLVALAVGAFLLLGGDDDGDREEIRAGIISVLNEDGELTDEQAGCLADHMIDELGEDRLEGVDFSADEPPPELEGDFTDAAFSGLEECDIELSEVAGGDDEPTDDGGSDDTATDDGSDGDLGTDGLPSGDFGPEFEEMLADIYADSFGISREKAECLAGKIADAMESGELGEEEMMNDIFGYFSDCDISMSEISGS